ncbi:MAG: hypothetical protein K8R88_08165, partial [Armatimonadetes bacterium]|nr:hypothetical protein [Armatimonadota bacterium]
AIIAILAAILFPVFTQAKLAAKKTQSLSNMKQEGTAMTMYLNDSDDQYPLAFYNYDPSGGYNWNRFIPVPATQLGAAEPAWKKEAAQTFVFNSVQPYAKSTKILQCPAGQVLTTSGSFGPAVQPAGLDSPTYTYNGLLNGYTQTAIAAPSSLPMLWHGHGARSLYGYGYASPWLACNDTTKPCVYTPSVPGTTGSKILPVAVGLIQTVAIRICLGPTLTLKLRSLLRTLPVLQIRLQECARHEKILNPFRILPRCDHVDWLLRWGF